MLASRLLRVVPDRLQREHRDDAFVSRTGAARVHLAPHLAAAEEWRLLIDEQYEAPGVHRHPLAKRARQLDHRRDAGAVVIRARRAVHRIVVSADDDDLVGTRGPFQLDQHVTHGCAAALVFLATNLVTRSGEARFDMESSGLEAIELPDVAFAGSDLADVPLQSLLERAIVIGQRRQRRRPGAPGHPHHVPEQRSDSDCDERDDQPRNHAHTLVPATGPECHFSLARIHRGHRRAIGNVSMLANLSCDRWGNGAPRILKRNPLLHELDKLDRRLEWPPIVWNGGRPSRSRTAPCCASSVWSAAVGSMPTRGPRSMS